MKRVVAAILLALTIPLGVSPIAAQPRPAQEEFLPVTDAETERLPAAPLVMSAYAVAWAAIFLYIWSLWRRLSRVERELEQLSQRSGARDR
ncbi:MAG: CcmD family protein [Vicinamibacterales bacterium]